MSACKIAVSSQSYNYEYNKLSQDQMAFISRIYIDAVSPEAPKTPAGGTATVPPPPPPTVTKPDPELARQAAVKKSYRLPERYF